MLEIPHLTTDRLLLRGFLATDFEPCAEMMANPDVTRYLGWARSRCRASTLTRLNLPRRLLSALTSSGA